MRLPVLIVLLAFSLGIIIGFTTFLPVTYLFLFFLFTLIGLLLFRIYKLRLYLVFPLVILSFNIGYFSIHFNLYARMAPDHIAHYVGDGEVILEGLVCESPNLYPDRTELVIASSSIEKGNQRINVRGHVLLSAFKSQRFKYGDYIRARTILRDIQNFRNPGVFDYKKHLSYRGIHVRGNIRDEAGIVILRTAQGTVLRTYLEDFRNTLRRFIQAHALSPEREILQAMILGEQCEISREIKEKFNATGTTHILAISGFNIGIVAFFSFFLIRLLLQHFSYLLLRFNITVFSTVLTIVPVIIYTMIAGAGISVVRATIMAVTFMVALILDKENDLYNALSIAALFILLCAPYSLFDISFQLSFAAVLSILFITPRLLACISFQIPERNGFNSKFSRYIVFSLLTFFAATVSATLGTLPLIVYYFNRVSMVTLIANICVTPLLGILTIPICALIIFSAFLAPFLTPILIDVASFLIWVSCSFVNFFSSLPGSSFYMFTPSFIEMIIYYTTLFVTFDFLEKVKRRKNEEPEEQKPTGYFFHKIGFTIVAAGIVISLVSQCIFTKGDDYLRVTFLDVGHGSSSFLQFPGGKTMLIDGGGMYRGDFDIGRNVVAPFLWHERIRSLDVVVLTHPHPDHLNGLIFILQNFKVKEVWSNGQSSSLETYKHFENIIDKNGILHRRLSQTQNGTMYIDSTKIQILNPLNPAVFSSFDYKYTDANNLSLVLRITLGRVSFLFPSDISEKIEKHIALKYQDLESQVLLVPHHGSSTSSSETFLKKIRPKVAVISGSRSQVGKHLQSGVLDRYQKIGTKILRTDLQGAIRITTDGYSYTLQVYHKDGFIENFIALQ